MDFVDDILKPIIFIILLLGLVFGSVGSCVYHASCRDAGFINQKYNTNFSCEDIFWSGDTIKSSIIGTQQNVKLQ